MNLSLIKKYLEKNYRNSYAAKDTLISLVFDEETGNILSILAGDHEVAEMMLFNLISQRLDKKNQISLLNKLNVTLTCNEEEVSKT